MGWEMKFSIVHGLIGAIKFAIFYLILMFILSLFYPDIGMLSLFDLTIGNPFMILFVGIEFVFKGKLGAIRENQRKEAENGFKKDNQ